MKKSLFMVAVLLLSLCMFTFSACDDNEEDKNVGKPVVALNEVGEENSKTAIAGSDLHLEGEITAENRIKRIDIEIHQEEGGEFRVEKSFTEGKYIGVKNTVPAPARLSAGNNWYGRNISCPAGSVPASSAAGGTLSMQRLFLPTGSVCYIRQ